MPSCFNVAATREWFLRRLFFSAGLRSTTTDLGDGTMMHCWVPLSHAPSKPSLFLIHGLGSNAVWQWNQVVPLLTRLFNIYVPDLVFFGGSHTSRPERSEEFQARCVKAVMDSHGVKRAHVAGISYGGFVAYSLAAQFVERVERVVICCAGLCMDDKDMAGGMFRVKTVDEATSVLLPQTPAKMRDLIALSFYNPIKGIPTCFLRDFIQFVGTNHLKERTELIHALHKERNMSKLPKITQPTLILWGDHDVVFPIELAYRLKKHIDGNSELVILKNTGHAINAEKPKEMSNHFKSFLIGPLPSFKHKLDGDRTNGYKGPLS